MVSQLKNLDNAVEVIKSMPDVDYYERIGSLAYYALKQFHIPANDAVALFQGTIIESFIEAPTYSQVIGAFASECKRILSPIYDGGVKSFTQEISPRSGMFYLVFFTGNVKEKGDETKFHECAKFLIDKDLCTLLNSDEQWGIKTSEEISVIWQRCQMWSKTQLGICLNNALKKHGYKFGSGKKDIIFLSVAMTDQFYKIKNIINQIIQYLFTSSLNINTIYIILK
jgi:hypothetical protein